jgi:hypothetical protein
MLVGLKYASLFGFSWFQYWDEGTGMLNANLLADCLNALVGMWVVGVACGLWIRWKCVTAAQLLRAI